MSRPEYATRTKFHLSLTVADLGRSVAFYRVLFGLEPAKRFDDYAKFELDDPPVIFSLTPHPPGPAGGQMSHAGLRVADHAAIDAVRQRLEAAGICHQCQTGAVCNYTRQDKLHVADPDGTHWEVYVVEEEVAPEEVERGLDGVKAEPPAAASSWEHFLTGPMPERVPYEDGALDEVRLTGTFNADVAEEAVARLVRDAARALRPGGRLVVHGLMSDRPVAGRPSLPGLAAMVSRVPEQSRPLALMQEAGFVGLTVPKYSDRPWFVLGGAELREVKVVGVKPAAGEGTKRVLYKGPLERVEDEAGTVFERGRRVAVSAATWARLREGPAAGQFLFLDANGASGCM